MAESLTPEAANPERMLEMLQHIRQDIARLEAMVTQLRPPAKLSPDEDIFAEMAGLSANAPHADDSREAIYTRMPGE
jgi:hypothetical protein